MSVLVDGHTPSGRHVRVVEAEGGYMERFEVFIDGERLPYSSASRMRDGGTTTIETEQGQIFAPRRLGAENGPDTFDGEPLD